MLQQNLPLARGGKAGQMPQRTAAQRREKREPPSQGMQLPNRDLNLYGAVKGA